MMVLLRAFALVVLAVGAGALHHHFGPAIQWDIGANDSGPLPTPSGDGAEPPVPDGDDGAEPPPTTTPDDDGEAEPENATETPEPALTYDDLAEHVGLDGARLIYEMAARGEASIVDARRLDDYVEGHIPLAFSVTPLQFVPGGAPPEATTMMDPELPVLIYCGGGDCDDSKNVGIKLRELGFKRLHILDDGFPAWVDAGYEVEKGPPL
jgi:rhodanese-related sulfurtransferase